MLNINKAVLAGRLGNDPKVKRTSTGKTLCSFSLATNKKWKDQRGEWQEHTEWHQCEAWSAMAENISKHVHKGDAIYIEGELRTTKWEKDGVVRYATNILIGRWQLVNSKNMSQQNGNRQNPHAARPEHEDIPY